MVSITRRYFVYNKTKNIISILAVSVSFLLILTLNGLYVGTYQQSSLYLSHTGADLWVAQKGASNFYFSISFLPNSVGKTISGISGVEKVSPFLFQASDLRAGGSNESVYYLGYDNSTGGLGGPWNIVQGSGVSEERQIVIDQTIATRLSIHLGDPVVLGNTSFTVVGISSGTNGITAPYVFVGANEFARLASVTGFANFFLVKVSPGVSVSNVMTDIRGQVPSASVFTSSQWIDASRNAILVDVAPTLQGEELMGGVSGILIIGFTNYVSTADMQREFGIAKALGTRNRTLIRIVFELSLLIAVAGFAIAAALMGVVQASLSLVVNYPLTIALDWTSIVEILSSAVLIGVVAALLPARKVTRIDPAIAFK